VRNQKGFSPVIILLILLLLAVMAFAGWRVWGSKDDSDSAKPSTSESEPAPDKDEPVDDPELAYVRPPSEVYRVAQPEGWVKATCADTPDVLFLAPSTDRLGKCGSESGGTVFATKSPGNVGNPEAHYTGSAHYRGVTYTPITIDGMNGYKATYTTATVDGLGYPPIGSQGADYVLFDGTNSFVLVYTRLPGAPDLAATVQTMAETFDKF